MNKDGAVAKELESIKNAFNYPEICHFIKYDDLVQNPEEEINKVYNFLISSSGFCTRSSYFIK